VYFFARGIRRRRVPRLEQGEGLALSIFKPVNEGGLGIERLSFYSGRVFGGIVHAENGVQGLRRDVAANLW